MVSFAGRFATSGLRCYKIKMKQLIKRIYSSDLAYRNFVSKEYKRRLQLHHTATAAELKAESVYKKSKTAKINKYVIIIPSFLLVILVIFYASTVVTTAAFVLLFVLASFSTIYKRKLGIPLGGVELVTFGTVITAVAFGPIIGLLFGLVSSLASEILSQSIGPLTWIYALTMAFVGAFAGIFDSLGLVFLGIAATVLTVLINQVIYLFIGDGEVKSMTAFYIAANIIFNIIVFTTISSRILTLLTY